MSVKMATILFLILLFQGFIAVNCSCKDKYARCEIYKQLCTSKKASQRQFMKKNCPKTCGFCAKECRNSLVTCDGMRRYCKKGRYAALVKRLCPLTCGVCGKKAPTPVVFDRKNCGQIYQPKDLARIVGGKEAPPHKWKWQGAMYVRNKFHCGGSLIKNDLFLTAAHCIDGSSSKDVYVVLGDHNRDGTDGSEQVMRVKKIIKHHNYYFLGKYVSNDIALLKLQRKAKLNEKVGIVCLPGQDVQPESDGVCYISGWGKIGYGNKNKVQSKLNEAKMDIVPMKTCIRRNKELRLSTAKHLCGGNRREQTNVSGCNGDSGGPYVCQRKRDRRWVLQGVVSYGSKYCDARQLNTVFTKVSKYIDWISKTATKLG